MKIYEKLSKSWKNMENHGKTIKQSQPVIIYGGVSFFVYKISETLQKNCPSRTKIPDQHPRDFVGIWRDFNNDFTIHFNNDFNNDFNHHFGKDFNNHFNNDFDNDCNVDFNTDFNNDFKKAFTNDFNKDSNNDFNNNFKNDFKKGSQ